MNAFFTPASQVCQQHNPSYKACFVSWNDNQRQQGSCWGSNITDARLKGRDGEDFLAAEMHSSLKASMCKGFLELSRPFEAF